MLHVGLDLCRRRVDVCLICDEGELIDQFVAPAGRDGLYGLTRRVAVYGQPVRGVVESMNGARFVHDELVTHGWEVLIADAHNGRTIRSPTSAVYPGESSLLLGGGPSCPGTRSCSLLCSPASQPPPRPLRPQGSGRRSWTSTRPRPRARRPHDDRRPARLVSTSRCSTTRRLPWTSVDRVGGLRPDARFARMGAGVSARVRDAS